MDLSRMLLGTNTAKLLASWMIRKEIDITHLLMPFNNLEDDGLCELAHAISCSKTLVVVDLAQNSITPRCAGALFKMISTNESIVTFNVGSFRGPERNRLGREGCLAIADAFRSNFCLIQYLSLKSTSIGS